MTTGEQHLSGLHDVFMPLMVDHAPPQLVGVGFRRQGFDWYREVNGIEQTLDFGVLPTSAGSAAPDLYQLVLVVRLRVHAAEPIYYDMLSTKPEMRTPYRIRLDPIDQSTKWDPWEFKDYADAVRVMRDVEATLRDTVIPLCERCSTPRGIAARIEAESDYAARVSSNPWLIEQLGDRLKRLPPSPRPVFGAALLWLAGERQQAKAYLQNPYKAGSEGRQLFASAFTYMTMNS